MAIVPSNYPEGKLSEEQVKIVKAKLMGEVWKCPPGNGPQFNNCYSEKGAVVVACANDESVAWLKERVPQMSLWEGAALIVDTVKSILKTFKVIVRIPDEILESVPEPSQIIPRFGIQNKDLKTEEWRLINRQNNTFVLTIDEASLKELQRMGLKAHLGLWQVTFKYMGKDDRPRDAEATTSKPSA